jgi:hypothetical protein
MSDTKDPLLLATPTAQRELFKRMSRACDGFSTEDAIGAAANVMINAIRQAHPTRRKAEVRFDELFGRLKQILVDHYESGGRKKGVFPYPQVIQMERFDARNRFGDEK